MLEERRTLDEFIYTVPRKKTIKEKMTEGWRKTKRTIANIGKWIMENPEQVAVTTTIAAGVTSLAKKGLRYATKRRETYNKQRFVYDHSAGRYLKTSRVLTSDDVRRINNLRSRNPGMKMSEALDRLNLLD